MRTEKISYVKFKLLKPCTYTSIVLLLLFVWLYSGSCSKSSGSVGIGVYSEKLPNKWVHKFHYLNGEVEGEFTAKSDSAQLIYSSNLESGTIDYQLYNSKDSLLLTIPANNTTNAIKGVFKKGEQYKVKATATEAKGSFDFIME